MMSETRKIVRKIVLPAGYFRTAMGEAAPYFDGRTEIALALHSDGSVTWEAPGGINEVQ